MGSYVSGREVEGGEWGGGGPKFAVAVFIKFSISLGKGTLLMRLQFMPL